MKQAEKNQLSREKILRAAIEEFGKKGYDGTSLNVLLTENGLSKGLVYHYFENKDMLYLTCVKVCFNGLTDVLSSIESSGVAKEMLQAYFEARAQFFLENPSFERIFFEALLQPPAHLQKELGEARAGFEEKNGSLFREMMRGLQLREGVSEEDAFYYFNLLQTALHLQFLPLTDHEAASYYDAQACRAMELLLYGVAGRELE